jgi:hypothetical protein
MKLVGIDLSSVDVINSSASAADNSVIRLDGEGLPIASQDAERYGAAFGISWR